MKSVVCMIGRLLLEILRLISGRATRRVHCFALVLCNCLKTSCTSVVVETASLLVLMSQAPQRLERQQNRREPGVCGDMAARRSLLLDSMRLRLALAV